MLAAAPEQPGTRDRAAGDVAATQGYWTRVAHIARARFLPFVAFAMVVWGFDLLRSVSLVGFLTPLGREALAMGMVRLVVVFLPMFLGLVLTEALGLQRWRHFAASLAAIVASQALSIGTLLMLYGGANVSLVEAQVIVSDNAFILRSFWVYACGGMLLVTYFAYRERELAAAKAALDANSRRATVERATIAARLKVMQARVEPELLFGALRDVRELYLRDRHGAEALLDDLIGYLRAALPQMRSDSSTLGREAALAGAYAKVLPPARRGELTVEAAVPDEAHDVAFPPMVLLPLVRAAVDSGVSRIAIEIDGAPATSATVRIDTVARAPVWSEAQLAPLRQTLALYFGPAARIEAGDARVVVRWNTWS
jgi:hypothetical protein